MIGQILKEEYEKIQGRNQNYSLRAFAKKVELSSGSLTEIIKGERRISKKLAYKILKNLDLSKEREKIFLASFEFEEKSTPNLEYHELQLDHYKVIAQWWHLAILNLTKLSDFQGDVSWIASRLGLDLQVAQDAVDRLFELKLLERQDGTWIRTQERLTTSDGISNEAIRSFHRQSLSQAQEKIDQIEIADRDFTCFVMPIDSQKIPEFKKMVRNFQDEASEFLESGDLDEVYQLNIQFYPLSIIKSAKNKGEM